MESINPNFDKLLSDVRACRFCEPNLLFGARPVIQAESTARLLIIGQAPGTRVHQTGIPFNDPSGDRLRKWLGIDRSIFYDKAKIALMPMGLCYPGKNSNGGDLPPRPECAPLWHHKVRSYLPDIKLTLLVGRYSQLYYLKNKVKKSGTETIRAWLEYLPDFLPLPHPSWRNNTWLLKNLWFERGVLPFLRQSVQDILKS
jgi:uracil-DNA glycosylase